MKWVFLLALFVFTPWLAVHLKANRSHIPYACFSIGLLPFLLSGLNLTASPIAWPHWPGPVKGVDISLMDGIAVALIYATKKVRTPFLLKAALALYLFGIVVSTIASPTAGREPSLFYLWQVMRAVLVYTAIARASVMVPTAPVATVMGLGAGLGFQGLISLRDFLEGDIQAGGWFGHQNLLGMTSHFAVFPAVALALAGLHRKWSVWVIAAGLLVAFTGGSRATIGLYAIGVVVTLLLSLWRQSTGTKTAVAGALIVGLIAAVPILYAAVERRPDKIREDSNIERALMIQAAKLIIADHPLGVGANRYVIVANVGGYSDRVGLAWNKANRTAPVHNSYYLVTAEMGWLGLFGMIAVLGSIIALGFRGIRSSPAGAEGELLVGLTGSAIMFSAHAYYEWVALVDTLHYLLAINVGLIVGVTQLARARKSAARKARVGGVQLARIPA